MLSRTIVTSQPDVACDVCERRLLRGEHPEIFLAAGQRRTVCELCAPRAAHQGWKRETEHMAGDASAPRPRRARGLLERLRAGARAADGQLTSDGDGIPEPAPDDFEEPVRTSDGERPPSARRAYPDALADGAGALEEERVAELSLLERALAIFNAGEYPRRIGGVARSLGAPEVSARELDVTGVVAIVVAWELCWYRYRVDIDDPDAGARLVAQGTELSELEREDRDANGAADDDGELHLLVTS